ncbi:MAG: anthranilate synthase component I family protein, partial [Candidatus Omnitrophica bacterium]|nr:anthranilate synthase component I family protein [Candidatus Omnitrophota bacterium]
MSKIDVLIEELVYPPGAPDALKTLRSLPYCFFLDSASSPRTLGRYSFLGCDPFLIFRSKRDLIELEWSGGKTETLRSNPFDVLRRLLKKYTVVGSDDRVPFVSGAVGYFAYDLKDFVEKLPDSACDDLDLPDCILGFYDTIVAYDNLTGRTYIVSSGLPELGPAANDRRKKSRLGFFKERISGSYCSKTEFAADTEPILESNFSKASYIKAVEKAKRYIKKGDIYQVNLSQRFHAHAGIDPLCLYSRLRQVSPAPFSSFLGFREVSIAGSSPERFLLKRGRYIETRPIKGTRPRGSDTIEDSLLAQELARSRKDRAEHIMIVDLERNDLGRICVYGSVRPADSFVLEKYSNVFHLVSTVTGVLNNG